MIDSRTLFFAAITLVAASTPSLAEAFDRQAATGACSHFIKKLLHDPGSASFGHSSEATVSVNGNKAMVIRSVRAKNIYGAKQLMEFMCLMEVNNGMITPVFVAPNGENPEVARKIIKKWKL